jgi:hypothetical protein
MILQKYIYVQKSDQKGISHPNFYGDFINNALKFKSDTSKLTNVLINLIRKGYYLATIVELLRQGTFLKNRDNLLLQQIDQASS